ncbi:integrase [Pandoraea horticolens]|uniref:Integrase n=1 Tax=Pandoraea horticolens TaxID=2508298 RepID=A0A5E4R6P0_9BURK|nr:integrase [Pandoraea horticolens]
MSELSKVRVVKLQDGERLPLLVSDNGMPLWEPTVYALSELRGKGASSSTLSNSLYAIRHLLRFLSSADIDLSKRLRTEGRLLALDEVDAFVAECREPFLSDKLRTSAATKSSNITSIERWRSSLKGRDDGSVVPAYTGMRIRYARDFIVWCAHREATKHPANSEYSATLLASIKLISEAMTSRVPPKRSARLDSREGLSPQDLRVLLDTIRGDSPNNPWARGNCRLRNELIVNLFLALGVRRGELLGVRTHDVDFRRHSVTVHRSADDLDDPRIRQPLTKTRARVLPIGEELCAQTLEYLTRIRTQTRGASRHDFLFCTSSTGAPLSIASLNKLFSQIRSACPEITSSFSPHTLRHTWNDRFSELMDERRVPEDEEKKLRSYLMGWSEFSGAASTYTRRHVREKAQRASIALQRSLYGESE